MLKEAMYLSKTFSCTPDMLLIFKNLVGLYIILTNCIRVFKMTGEVILVTGGAGFIGSHCVVTLLENQYEVIVIDNLVNAWKDKNTDKPESLIRSEELTGKKLTYYTVDLLDIKELDAVFSKHRVDCVIHFAALKAVGESCQIPIDYYKNNVAGSLNLIETMRKHNVKCFIFSSSSTVYGAPQFLPLTEKHPTGQGCTNPYGKTKYFVEEILKDVCASDEKWRIISLRYFNPVGAHQSGRIGEDPSGIPNNLMPYIAQVAVGKRKLLNIFGNDYDTIDGTGVRDYIHIMDLADGHVHALRKLISNAESDKFNGFKAYNLGTGSGYSVMQVLEAFKEACGCDVPYKITGRRSGDVASSYCDVTLANKELNWQAKYHLKDMCEDTWRWQSQNPNGYKNE